MKKSKLFRGVSAACLSLTVFGICVTSQMFEWSGSIDNFLGIENGSTSGNGEMKYKSSYGELNADNLKKLINDEKAYCKKEMEEGAVLLKNDGTLPLASNIKNVSLFGRASYDMIYKSHAGGGIVSQATAINLKQAMEDSGFKVNNTLWNAYKESKTSRVKGSKEGTSKIGEENISFYNGEIKSSFANYKDAAIVVLSRDSGEGQDFNKKDADGLPQLALHQEEKDLLNMIKNEGFNKIVVLLNSGNAMEVGWLDEYNVNACMWIGQPGRYGLQGVPSLLKGEANPSGHLVDTYAKNSLSSPAMVNTGDFTFENSESDKYIVYQEGIYVGYKYYETRYEDSVLNRYGATSSVGKFASTGDKWNYVEEVSYPFGYGLSYTTFKQELTSFTYDASSDNYIAKVKVTNTGNKDGKSVVQLYMQSPYTQYDIDNKIEKAAVQLVGFEKTNMLQAGKSEEITINVDRYYTATYDENNAKGYILDAGNYYFAIGDDSHDALNNILAKKGATGMVNLDGTSTSGDAKKVGSIVINELDKTSYKKSNWTDQEVTNAFEGDYAIDVNDFYDDNPITYLTRSDWANTYPTSAAILSKNDNITKAMVSRYYQKASDTKGLTNEQINGVNKDIEFVEMYGLDYNDPKWDDFLDQLSVEDMSLIISDSLGQGVVKSVNKPANKNADGPDGYGMNYRYGDQDSPTCYNIENLAVSSWSKALMEERGSFYGEDAIYSRGQMAWAPGIDIHRTPYGGRNFEYASEDGFLTGIMMACETKAMSKKGVIPAPKHLFGNEQETNRSGACTFMTEQVAREVNLRAFELPFTIGECRGAMLAMNRIGCKMSPVAKTTLTNILKGEWGFKGILVTDSSGAENDRIPTVESILAGTGMFCLARRSNVIKSAIVDNNDSYLYDQLRTVNHNFYYQYVNSTLVNGLSKGDEVSENLSWWKPTVISIDVVLGLAALAFMGGYIYLDYIKKAKEGE